MSISLSIDFAIRLYRLTQHGTYSGKTLIQHFTAERLEKSLRLIGQVVVLVLKVIPSFHIGVDRLHGLSTEPPVLCKIALVHTG